MYKITNLDKIAFILIILGSIVWGIYGLLGVNVLEVLFRKAVPFLERLIYILVGLSGLDLLFFLFKTQKN
ncbi:DUF378 domain-containing protein [Hathewaya limosa]|uniref:Uncharacterized membrane protein YuzA (DUF378 family) n=1 Tax=Hathewaya limosa TaxID=1536 RepID=A0ABU0JP38_HATLI|nr:DUF378 domain-containing protein [Hathewaya limosa]AWZ48584.1 DUF378 domain-containing protein [Clostridiaceae bacterium 14S0207]MDQ0478828.1 uncharacterized membrane protein YuzA (DUF378 family) [Hathewaya limosa]